MAIRILCMKALLKQIGLGMLLLVVSHSLAQSSESKLYSSELDSLWSRNVYINHISKDGKWIVIGETFDYKSNALILKNISDTTTFIFPESNWIQFSKNNRWFGCIALDKELYLVDLETKTQSRYADMLSYSFSDSGDYLAGVENVRNKKILRIINLKNKETSIIEDVKNYSWQPNKNSLLISVESQDEKEILAYDVMTQQKEIIYSNKNSQFSHLKWSSLGNSIVFLDQSDSENYIRFYKLKQGVKTLDNLKLQKRFPGFIICDKEVLVSEDGSRIFFYRKRIKSPLKEAETMEVWNSDDPWIYPKMKDFQTRELQNLLTIWFTDTDSIIAIETEEKPTSALRINNNYAIVFHKMQYEPRYREFPISDIYVKDLSSGQEDLVVKEQYTESGFITLSPSGQYVAYFKNLDWWVYDIYNKKTVNITKNLNGVFYNNEMDRAGYKHPVGKIGWTLNDKYIIINDAFDIWLISPDGNYKERITKGQEEGVKYRIITDQNYVNYHTSSINAMYNSLLYNPEKGVLLEKKNKLHKTGFAVWKGEKLKDLLFEDKNLSGFIATENLAHIFYGKQRYNQPTAIFHYNLATNQETLIYQSNEKLMGYDLGRAELIHYKVGDDELTGTLMYPANFDPNKEYPMIVCIYERMSGKINDFVPPSEFGYDGFNRLSYITNGYFVLYPDIYYTIGEPGVSALNCVTSAVNKALENGNIDKSKLGLLGHSFGGYETAFIATQTDMFAAIVAGAAVTDFTSHYHSVGWNWNMPEIWRYENQQWRMGDSYYNIKEAYLRNSPLHQVENVKTPLLLWTGKEDYQIIWTQSIEMFIALKRLNKPSKLLIFENDGHVLFDKVNQRKLSKEIKNWFDSYLL